MTELIKVSVKWGKQLFEDLEVDTSLPPVVFKGQLCSLTGVPPQRQKILGLKGGPLKDEGDWDATGIKEGDKLMLVGTPEGSEINAPKIVPAAKAGPAAPGAAAAPAKADSVAVPCGLVNLGNTCYLNSVVQFLRSAPEIVAAMDALPEDVNSTDADVRLCATFRSFMQICGKAHEAVPLLVVEALRIRYPLFATKSRSGEGFAQQDAEECLSSLLTSFATKAPKIAELLEITFDTSMQCVESPEEPPTHRVDKARHLSCHTGTQLKAVDHVHQGIQLSLDESMTKFSETLGRNANYRKIMKIATLPQYLIIHFVRFAWKGASDLGRTEAGRAKVCRKIAFPTTFDVYEFCTPDLQKELSIGRALMRHQAIKQEEKSEKAEKKRGVRSGHYELISIVTHRGRSADSGHYIAWTRKDDEIWYKLDDEKISQVRWKTVDLAGGRGDFHIAILLLFREKLVYGTEAEIEAAKQDIATGSSALPSPPPASDVAMKEPAAPSSSS